MEIVFDPFHVTQDDITDEGEQRLLTIGRTKSQALLVVAFVDRSQPNVEIFRFISARKAEKYEQSIYKDQFR